jgi:hypothetical protein
MDKWYDNPDLLRAAYEEYGSLERASEAIGGGSPSTLRLAWRRHKLDKLPRGPAPSSKPNSDALRALHARVYG